jgi:hypothetical protein
MSNTETTFLLNLVMATLISVGTVCADNTMAPRERVAITPKGELRNPYSVSTTTAEEGHRIYMSLDCGSCHGGGGGGGMAAPLTIRFGSMAAMTTHSSGWSCSARSSSRNRVIPAKVRNSSSGQCLPSVTPSRPTMTCGRLSLGSGR